MGSNLAFRTETLRYDDLTIHLRTQSLRTELESEALYKRLDGKVEAEFSDYLFSYIAAVAQTVHTEGLGFTMPAFSAPDEAHLEAFRAFTDIPARLMTAWVEACYRLNAPLGTVEVLQPGGEAKDPKQGVPAPTSAAE